jgi:sugar-specific transcriptional regulator TrmB
MLEKYLQDLGLSDKEASVYLSLLQVDSATALDISKKTNINRSTVYVVIESLSQKGLVSETTVGKKTQFQAEPPERLETYIEGRRIHFEEQSHRIKDIIPEIKSIQRETGERPVVKYFEGREGVISLLEEFYSFLEPSESGKEVVYIMYPRDALEEVFTTEEREKYRKIRLGRKVKSRSLYTSEKGDRPSDDMAERLRIVDSKKYPISSDISIYKDRIRITT